MSVKVNLDGEIVAPHQARVSIFDRGFLYGDSIYEVMRTYAGVAFALDRHLERLERSARTLHLALPGRPWLEHQLGRTLREARNPESYVRIIVTRGSGPLSLDPTRATDPLTVILVKPYEPFPEWTYRRGIRVTIPQVSGRLARAADDPAAKTGNTLNSVLAMGAARRRGFDDALLLDNHGRVSEATSANLFAVFDGALCTPSVQTGLLTGVTRGLVIELAAERGLPVAERDLTPERLMQAQELMLTSTLREIMPVVEVDGQPIGDGRPGALTGRLAGLFHQRALAMCGAGG